MAVPAHTRNDFSEGHSRGIGCPDGGWLCGIEWIGNPYEGYVRDNFDGIYSAIPGEDRSVPFTGEKKLTNFWDTETFSPGTVPTASTTQGLAEYTNSNFVSYATVFKRASEDPLHTYPYPARSSMTVGAEQVDLRLYEITAKDGHIDKGVYVTKTGQGESIDHFLKPRYVLYGADWDTNERYDLRFTLDDQCFKDYASKLLPRAIGYASGLLDYFFRGKIEISLPDDDETAGVYAVAKPESSGFARIVMNAKNISPDDEVMGASEDGSIDLVVKYRVALADPFSPSSYPDLPVTEFRYIVAHETHDIKSIPRDTSVRLAFDLPDPLPIWATDVTVTLVFKGTLGAEEGDAVVVGTKDISEPTPIHILNNLDKICISGGSHENNIYDAGSPEVIALADTNHDGEINNGERDVFSHNLGELHARFFTQGNPRVPAYTPNDDVYVNGMSAGEFVTAAYVLGELQDYPQQLSLYLTHGHVDLLKVDSRDPVMWHGRYLEFARGLWPKTNQFYRSNDPSLCSQHNESAPCDIRDHNPFHQLRGHEAWGALIYGNDPNLWKSRPEDPGLCLYSDL